MELLGVEAFVSVVLFAVGTWLFMRAATHPPVGMRSESGRSPAEYAFRAHAATLRRSAELCVLVGVLNLVATAVIGVMYLLPDQ